MYQIIKKKRLSPNTVRLDVKAPFVAKKAEPGQFVILRINEQGERVPLTVADYDREKGVVSIIFQEVGKTTVALGQMEEGDEILDFVGPLGGYSPLEGYRKAAVIGGGLGVAIAYPQAKKLFSLGTAVHFIAGFRNKDFIILEEEARAVSELAVVATDDGSNGVKGFVTDVLKKLIDEGNEYDVVIAVGPLPMMKFVSLLTKQYGIKTIVSMCPVMVDGTGMCGGCRVTVGDQVKFACVDGPDFDGHLVDFDEAIRRQVYYKEQEALSLERHNCRMEEMFNEKHE